MEQVGKILDKAVAYHQRRPSRNQISQHSAHSLQRDEFLKSMLALVALKRTAAFTEQQVEAWYAVLAGFKPKTLNRAILTVCASQERFPELSDVFQACRQIEPRERPYNPHGGGGVKPLYEDELIEIAERLGMEV